MKQLVATFLLFSFYSCIPLSVAPNIETDKLVKAKRFKRDLPDEYAFIFEDPKDADEFYHFMDAKYNLNSTDVESNVPIIVDETTYFLSFFEREKSTKTLNLVPLAIDAALVASDVSNDTVLDELHTSRSGQWYLILTVSDANFKDSLHPHYGDRENILAYLRKLQEEYLSTQNYVEVHLKEKH